MPLIRKIASTLVHKRWIISTIDVGWDLSYGRSELPLTYETCMCDTGATAPEFVLVRTYGDETAARHGHRRIVAQLRKGVIPPPLRDGA